MTGLPQLKAVSIRTTVTDAVRKAMLDGRLQPGQPLSEAVLAAEMNVSRGPVREALFTLAKEGLVKHSQNYGFSVAQFTEQDRTEVQQVRVPLEVLALTIGKGRLRPDQIDELRQLRDVIADSFQRGSYPECTHSDLTFHQLIWKISGNGRLMESLCNLMIPYFAYGSAFNISRPDLTSQLLYEQHDAYVQYLTGETSLQAEEIVRAHSGL